MVTGKAEPMNRSLAAKHERAVLQRMERAHAEYSKSGYATARPFEADHVKPHRPAAMPKRVSHWKDRSTLGIYIPRTTARQTPAMYSLAVYDPTETRLFRNGAWV
jgi:hypothetical protein